jgi:hypothetical protein
VDEHRNRTARTEVGWTIFDSRNAKQPQKAWMAVVHTTTTTATTSFPPYSHSSHFQLIQVNNGRFIAILSTRFVVLSAVVIDQVFLLNLFVQTIRTL